MLDLKKPGGGAINEIPNQSKIQFFAVFDGHGGQGCAEFLRDNLHNFIAHSSSFPLDLEKSLQDGFRTAERRFMEQNFDSIRDKSGSCAIVCLLTDTNAFVANVGDSRAFMSTHKHIDIV